jgi:hypothetical protein
MLFVVVLEVTGLLLDVAAGRATAAAVVEAAATRDVAGNFDAKGGAEVEPLAFFFRTKPLKSLTPSGGCDGATDGSCCCCIDAC